VTVKKAVDILSMEGLTYSRSRIGIKVNHEILKEKIGSISCFKIGVIFLDFIDMYSTVIGDIVHGIVDAQKKLGFQVKFTPIPSQQPLGDQLSVLEDILSSGVDGLIVASRMPLGIIARLQGKNIRFVLLNNNIPHEKIYSVMFDKSETYLRVIERIKKLGFNRAALIAPVLSVEDSNLFVNLCRSSGINLKTFAYDTIKKPEEIRQVAADDMLKLIPSADRPEVIISAGEIETTGVLQAIFGKGLRIPEDIHVIAISEQESLQFRTPAPIDILVQSFSDLANEASIMLYELLKGEKPEPHIRYLPVKSLKQRYVPANN
jgi:DNA-binding LacI/PurR family transcriptional regulator